MAASRSTGRGRARIQSSSSANRGKAYGKDRKEPDMSGRLPILCAVVVGWLLSASPGLIGQAPAAASPSTSLGTGPSTSLGTGKAWRPPRTVDGQPDLQGVWANNNATPLERPAALPGKTVLTETEAAALKARAQELFSGDGDAAFGDDVFTAIVTGVNTFASSDRTTGNYNQFWIA